MAAKVCDHIMLFYAWTWIHFCCKKKYVLGYFHNSNNAYIRGNFPFHNCQLFLKTNYPSLNSTFPDRIRVIVTAEPGSLAMKHFEKIQCQVIPIQIESFVPSQIIDQQLSRPTFVVSDLLRNIFWIKDLWWKERE